MREFDLLMPRSLAEALDALASDDGAIQPLAGGTDMVVNIRARVVQPRVLVTLSRIAELCDIRREDGRLRVGSGVNVAHFLKHPLLLEHADVARQAAAHFANPMIRNLATVGGNLASASPAADLAPPLLALGAEVELASKHETRTLALEDLFIAPRKTVRRADEIITALHWSIPSKNSTGAFYKLGLRQADAISVVSVAVWLERDGDKCRDVRIALGAVAPRPLRAHRAENVLIGQPLTDATMAECARVASEECNPIDDLRGSGTYRRRMVRVYVERMLRKAWGGSM
jgi:aerobic carbon-monoxide dehydrogenase medium subunit